MAVQIDLNTSQYGVPFIGAYFRIVTVAISRQREGGPKFFATIDVAGYGTSSPGDDIREIDFRRYHTALENIEAQQGVSFLDRCYTWVMAQDDMAGSIGV